MPTGKRTLQVLLIEDVQNLGDSGDVVEVTPGFARNYLLPQQLAIKPSKEGLRQVEHLRRRRQEEADARRKALEELAERIPLTNITIEAKASPEGHLYGSVTAAMISDAMRREGIELDASHVRLEEHIKEIGQYQVPIHVFEDVTVEARVWVVNAP